MSEITSNKSQQVKGGSHHSPNQSSINDPQTSPRIHMSVREKHSTSSVSSVGSARSSVVTANGQERRNSSVIVIEHFDRVNASTGGSSESTHKPAYRSPDNTSSNHPNNVVMNNQTRHHSVNVAVGNTDHRTTSIDESTEKSTELVSSHIFV